MAIIIHDCRVVIIHLSVRRGLNSRLVIGLSKWIGHILTAILVITHHVKVALVHHVRSRSAALLILVLDRRRRKRIEPRSVHLLSPLFVVRLAFTNVLLIPVGLDSLIL